MSPGNRHGIPLGILFTLLPVFAAAADEAVRVGRYSTIAPVPTPAQTDPLQAPIEVRFPEAVLSVGDAFGHLLRGSGYQLAPAYASDPLQATLLAHPLPASHRMIGPLTLERALTTLAGPAFRLVIDPVHRLVSFEVAETHRLLFDEPLAVNAGMLLAQAGEPPTGMPAIAPSPKARPAAPSCPPAGAGPVQRNLTVPFAERLYRLASGEICSPAPTALPKTTAEAPPAESPPPRPVSPVLSLSPFNDWRRGGNR